jgi:glycosyltransferase involved in cell wall biosynthesis
VKVLGLIDSYQVSGPCRGLFQLAQQTRATGIQFVVGLFLVDSWVTSPALEEAKRRGIPVATLLQKRRYDWSLIPQAQRIIREQKVRVLQTHNYKPAFIAWCLKSITGLPWVAWAHGYTSENLRVALYNRLDRWLMRRADRVVVVCESMKRLLRASGVSENRIEVIYNAIEPADHPLSDDGDMFRHQCRARANDLLIGVIGRLSPEKGHAVFVQAFENVVRTVPQARAVLVGEGQELERLRASVRAARLDSRITFAGYQRDTSSVYAALDLVVIPSLSEGLPNVLLEAMLHRKAIVATAVGAIPEVMQAALSRWLVPPGDAERLAQTVIEALQNPALRQELGEIGERRVREAFSPSYRAERIVALYRELVGQEA